MLQISPTNTGFLRDLMQLGKCIWTTQKDGTSRTKFARQIPELLKPASSAKSGRTHTVHATREIILSAGGIQSPQLLELSGIGNSTLLTSLGIKTRIDNPMVGENYQVSRVTAGG